jgi:hypothetical protein
MEDSKSLELQTKRAEMLDNVLTLSLNADHLVVENKVSAATFAATVTERVVAYDPC